jgi:hypothetical protein
MMNGQGCPLPSPWRVDWSLRNSTIAMPERGGAGVNASGFWPSAANHHWGAVSLDWQVGEPTWLNVSDPMASTCEATSAANCRRLKEAGVVARCGIYHNVELALQWIESARAVMYDPTKAEWFLQYTDWKRSQKRHDLQRASRGRGPVLHRLPKHGSGGVLCRLDRERDGFLRRGLDLHG